VRRRAFSWGSKGTELTRAGAASVVWSAPAPSRSEEDPHREVGTNFLLLESIDLD